ncbi:alanine racemase [Leptospira sp. 96542]|nr:alanine racemase [Leptospira sp. 96542]
MLKKSHIRNLAIVVLIISLFFILQPKDEGHPHSEYFSKLNSELKSNGFGRPVILLDLDRLDENLQILKSKLYPPLAYRIVVKSLPSKQLLRYIIKFTNTEKLMVFHSADLVMLLNDPEFNSSDILLGKPMPVKALEDVYSKTKPERFQKLRWLVDSKKRLDQYLSFSQKTNTQLRIVLEIDIGLHRGGFSNMESFKQTLNILDINHKSLIFEGFMGYEPHVASTPNFFGDKTTAIDESLQKSLLVYEEFYQIGKKSFPLLFDKPMLFNGGGSKTYQFYQNRNSIVNDVSVGSALVMPTDFDVVTLKNHKPAFFIAAPVLKKLEGTTIPFLESLSFLFPLWNPNLQVTYFTYGGAFLAKKESPKGLYDNQLFGLSTNQGILNGSKQTKLEPDDYVFYRPTQSEKVLAEMGEIVLIRQGKIIGTWKTFSN